jgi:hypothetical protein
MTKIKHKTIYTSHYWNSKTDHKVYDYNDGVVITDKVLYDGYVVNVPCYKVEDVTLAMSGDKRNYWFGDQDKHVIKIQTSNHRGKQYYYLLATPEMDKFVKQQATFGAIKGHITKMPKKHLKVVHVINRGSIGRNRIKVDLYIQDKNFSEYLTKECLKNTTV